MSFYVQPMGGMSLSVFDKLQLKNEKDMLHRAEENHDHETAFGMKGSLMMKGSL
jgi:hypothetical protein